MDPRAPDPDRPRSALLQRSTTTSLPKRTVPARAFRQPYLRRVSYDPSQFAEVDVVHSGEQRRRSLSSLDPKDDLIPQTGSTSRELSLALARDAPDSLDHQQVNAPGTILPSLTSTTRLLSHPQEYPTSRHGSSNTQFYYVPAGDARGLGIITETSESSASLAALSPRQAITNVPPYVNTQIQTLFTTRSDQDNATAPLSSPYIPIAESVKKRAVDGPAAKATEPGVPNVVGRVSPFAVAMSSFTSSPETSILCDGTLWYLYVRSGPPYRWVHCKAILTKTRLELSWNNRDGPSSVEFDLLRCLQVRAMPCASHPSARADIGSVAAYEEKNASLNLVEDLYPFHITYKEDVERLAADSVRERIRWVGYILDAITKLESDADCTHTSPMSHRPRLRSFSIGSSSQSHFSAPRSQTDGSLSAFGFSMSRFSRGLRHHSRTKSGGDLPTPAKEDPRRKPTLLRRTNSMLANHNPAHSALDQPAPPTSSMQKRKISNPMSFVTGILGKITPSEGPSSRFFTRSRLLSRRGLDTPSPVPTSELAFVVGSTTNNGGPGSAQEMIQNITAREGPPTVVGLGQATTAKDVSLTPSSFSHTSGGPRNGLSKTASGVCLASDPSSLSTPPRMPRIGWWTEESATGADSGASAYATANVISSSSSPHITTHSQPSGLFSTPSDTSQTAQHSTAPGHSPHSRVTSTSTAPPANVPRSSLHSKSSSNKDLPALPAPLLQRRDGVARPESLLLTIEDITALESPKSWRSLSPQEENPSSVPQLVRTPAKKAAITNEPRYPSTFRQPTTHEDWLGPQDSPLFNRSASLHTHKLSAIGSSTLGSARVTPQEPFGTPLLQDTSRCPTPTLASALRGRRTSSSTPSSSVLKPTLPLRLSSRRSSIILPTTPTTSAGRNYPTRSFSVTSSRSHRASWADTTALEVPPDQESPATVQDIFIQLRRREGERVEETHALSQQLNRIEEQLTHLSEFVRQHARRIGLRPSGEPVVSVANLDRSARSEPPGEDAITWPTPPTGDRTELVDNMLVTLKAATEASENGSSEELEDEDQRSQLSAAPVALTPKSRSRPAPPPNTPASTFTPISAGKGPVSSSIQPNLLSPSFLKIPDGSRSIVAQVTNAELVESLNVLRRVIDCFIRWQRTTSDMLEDLRGRIPVQQMEGPGVSGPPSCTQALNHIPQSLGAIADQLPTSSDSEWTKLSAPFGSPVALDTQKDSTIPKATPQIRSAPCSPLPQPPSVRLAHNSALSSLPTSSSAAYPRIHTNNGPIQRSSIWQPRARRVVPRRRVFSEPASSACQTASGVCNSIEQERERAPDDSGTPNTAIRRPSILRSRSPDRTPPSSAQSKTSGKANVSTSVRPTYQRSVSAPVPHEGVSVKPKTKRRNVAWASPLVSDFNTFETSIARTDFDLQTPLDDAQVVSALCPQVDFQEVLQLLKEINLRQVTASKQQSEVVRYLTELNEWLGRDQQDRQSEFFGIGSQIEMLHALINEFFVHQTTPTSSAVASRSPHDAHGSTGALQSQDAINRDIIIPKFANSDVARSIATVPRTVTGTTELLAQSMPPTTSSLSRSSMDSTSHNPTPSSLDILANTAQLTNGSPASPSFPLSAQRQSESPPAEAPTRSLRIVNLTEQDTFRSTSSSNVRLFQSLRTAGAPSPALVHPETQLSYVACHAPLFSSLGHMDDHPPPFTLSHEPLIQPLPQEVIIPSPSSPSKGATQEASYPAAAEPGQTILPQTPVRPFPGDRSTEQNTVDPPFPPQLTAVNFPEPCYFLDGSVPTPVPGTSPLSSDANSYPQLTTPFSLKSRRAVSLPASPGHGSGGPTSQNAYSNQANSLPIASIEAPPDGLEPYSTVHVQSLQNPNCHPALPHPLQTPEPSTHESSAVPEPIVKRPLPQPVALRPYQGESWLEPQTALRPEDSISMAGALQGSHGLQAPPRLYRNTTVVPHSPIVVHPAPRLPVVPAQASRQPRTAFIPAQNSPGSRSLHERTRIVSAPSQELPLPDLVRGTSTPTQQRNNGDTRSDIPVAPSTHEIVQDILASMHMSLATQKQDRDSYIQQMAQIARRDGAWLEEERKKVRVFEEELQRLRVGAEAEHRGQMSNMQTEWEEARLAAEAKHNSIISHFREFTIRINESLQEGAAQRQMITEHLNLNERKRGERDARLAALESMLKKLVDDETAERLRAQRRREEEALRPGAEQVIEELWRHNIEHQRLMTDFMNASLARNQQQHEETLDVVRRTASEQIPFNIQKYLEEFSNSLAVEVSTLLQEVGQLREDRRSLQHEIGYLLCLKSKYTPGGEFNTGWQPPTTDVRYTHTTAEPEAIGRLSVIHDPRVTVPLYHPPASASPPPIKLGTLRKKEKVRGKSRTSAPTNDTQAPSPVPIVTHHSTPFTVSNNITPAAPSSRTPRLYGPRVPETGVTTFRHTP